MSEESRICPMCGAKSYNDPVNNYHHRFFCTKCVYHFFEMPKKSRGAKL